MRSIYCIWLCFSTDVQKCKIVSVYKGIPYVGFVTCLYNVAANKIMLCYGHVIHYTTVMKIHYVVLHTGESCLSQIFWEHENLSGLSVLIYIKLDKEKEKK